MKTRKSINIYGNRRPKTGRLVANPIPPENIFWYDIFEPIVEAINKLFNGTSLTYKESDTIVFGPDASINVNVNLLNRLNGNSLFQGRNIPFATINGEKIFDSNKNIIIEGGGGSYTAGDHIIIENNVISADLSDYYDKKHINASFNIFNNKIDSKQDILIAGDNITIGEGNVISATNTTYSAGQNITILNGVISAIDTTYEGSDFDIKDLSDSTNLKSLWSGKQDRLIAGTNIIITGNTISAVQSAGFAVLIVSELPETGDQNTIYFLSNPTGTFPNIYNEYMYINNNWELIGNTAIDLSNYYTKTEIGTIVNDIETEISSKQSALIAGSNITINGNTISATDTTYSDATQTTAGLMSSTDKIKLDGLNNYVLPTANFSVLGGIKIGNNLTIDSNGVVSANDTTYSAGSNINITNNTIKAEGYKYNPATGAFAEGDRDIDNEGAIRPKPSATGVMAHAEGINTNAVGRASHAEGTITFATGIQSHAEGFNTNAIGVNSHTEGRQAVTNGYASHAEGDGSETGGNYDSATSNPKTADSRTVSAGDYAHAEGLATIAYGVASHAEGRLTFAKGDNSHAEGVGTKSFGDRSHAEGEGCLAEGKSSHAEGNNTQALGYNTHAEGRLSKVNSVCYAAHAEGYNTEVGGSYTTNTKTAGTESGAGTYAHAEGNSTIANGIGAHSEGKLTLAKGNASHAEGNGTIASGAQSHAEGGVTNVTAAGANGHAEGRNTIVNGYASHAEGDTCETGGNYTSNTKTAGTRTANGDYAHAEGNATIANGVAAHSEGRLTLAKGDNSHAEGAETITNGGNSHAEGRFTKTLCNAEHAQGSYNVSHHTTDSFDGNAGNTVHSTGIGTADNARMNAVEVMQNGDLYLFNVGSYDGIHIKNESGAPANLQTLQEIISSLQWKIKILEPVKNNEIRYKTSNETIIYPSMQEQYTALSYNEKGILVFNNDLTEINDDAFVDMPSLIEIELPEYEDFYRIGNNSFKGTGLKEIIIPKYITEIGDYAFAKCANLKTVKYNGTIDDWNNMTLGADIFENTQVIQVICIDGVVTI